MSEALGYSCRHCNRVELLEKQSVVEWVCKTCGVRNFLPGGEGVRMSIPVDYAALELRIVQDELERTRRDLAEAEARKDWGEVAELNGRAAYLEELLQGVNDGD